MQRYLEPDRLGGLKIDDQLEFEGRLNGKLARFRAFEDAIGIRCRTAKIISPVNSV
jgi:hypothetical protein